MDFQQLVKNPVDLGIKIKEDITLGPYGLPAEGNAVLASAKEEFLQNLVGKVFYGEYGQPSTAGMDQERFYHRCKTIDMKNVCCEIKITNYYRKNISGYPCFYLRAVVREFGDKGEFFRKEIAMGGKATFKMRYFHKAMGGTSQLVVGKKVYTFKKTLITDITTFDYDSVGIKYLVDIPE